MGDILLRAKPFAPTTFDAAAILAEQNERLATDNAALRAAMETLGARYSSGWEHLPCVTEGAA